jgi:phage tail-like protein
LTPGGFVVMCSSCRLIPPNTFTYGSEGPTRVLKSSKFKEAIMPGTGDRNDPLMAFSFVVKFDDIPASGFSECSGLQIETAVQDHTEGGANSFVHRFPTRSTQSNVTLKRGIVDREYWNWYEDVMNGSADLRGGTISVRDPQGGAEVMVWHLKGAFPRKWVGPDLNATQSKVAVETLEICHQGFDRDK